HRVHRLDGAGGFVGQGEGGGGVVAQQRGAFAAQLQHFGDDAGVVPLVAAAAAGDGRLVHALAQGAVVQLRQQRLAGGVEQGQQVLALMALGLGGRGGG